MTRGAARRFLYLALGLITIFFVLRPAHVKTGDDVAIPEKAGMQAVGVAESTQVVQQFPATGEAITAISLLLATYQRTNAGDARITIQAEQPDGQWRALATRSVRKDQLEDNAYFKLTFSPPLGVDGTPRLAIVLQADGEPSQAIAWWVNQTWTPTGYQLLVNGQTQPGTACFTVQYEHASGPTWRMLPFLWRRITVFLNSMWQATLLCGTIIALVTFLLLTARGN